MALVLKPHSWNHYPATQAIGSDVYSLEVSAKSYGSASPRTGMIQPRTPEAAYKATGLEMTRPHEFFEDSADVKPGDKEVFGSRVFIVATPQKTHSGTTSVAHVTYWANELQYG